MKPRNTIWVRNNGHQPISSRYDGEDFVIMPGEYLEMEIACAELVFGFGNNDKARAIARLGWSKTQFDMAHAIERLNTFSFHMSEQEAKGHSSAPVDGPSPAAPSGLPKEAVQVPRAAKSKAVRAKPRNALEKLASVQPPAS